MVLRFCFKLTWFPSKYPVYDELFKHSYGSIRGHGNICKNSIHVWLHIFSMETRNVKKQLFLWKRRSFWRWQNYRTKSDKLETSSLERILGLRIYQPLNSPVYLSPFSSIIPNAAVIKASWEQYCFIFTVLWSLTVDSEARCTPSV